MSHRWLLLPAILGILVAGFFLIRSLDDDLVYFFYPTDAVERRDAFADGRRFRLAGIVVPGTLSETEAGYRFVVSDGETTVPVELVSTPPPLFQEDVEVLLDGSWQGETFQADGALIRHDENYEVPEEGDYPVPEDGPTARLGQPAG